jgi:sodium-independent sulfate anion transporter 11
MDMALIKTLAPSLPATFVVLLIEVRLAAHDKRTKLTLFQHISIAKSFGIVNNYTIDPSQEILAIGVSNILGPFIGAFPAVSSHFSNPVWIFIS